MTESTLRAATFNIRHAAPKDSYWGHPARLAEICAGLDVDILGLQEVDLGVWRSGFRNLARVAARAAGMSYAFRPARTQDMSGLYGNALLVRGGISNLKTIWMRGDHRHHLHVRGHDLSLPERRNAIIATATLGDRQISTGVTHLACSGPGRQEQVQHRQLGQVVGALLARPAPHLLLGDLNIPHAQVEDWLQPYNLELACATPPGIDHVAVGGLALHDVQACWLPVSDHPIKTVELHCL